MSKWKAWSTADTYEFRRLRSHSAEGRFLMIDGDEHVIRAKQENGDSPSTTPLGASVPAQPHPVPGVTMAGDLAESSLMFCSRPGPSMPNVPSIRRPYFPVVGELPYGVVLPCTMLPISDHSVDSSADPDLPALRIWRMRYKLIARGASQWGPIVCCLRYRLATYNTWPRIFDPSLFRWPNGMRLRKKPI